MIVWVDYTLHNYVADGTWDNHTAFLNPSDLSIRALVGSLDLLSMELELELQKIIAANDGFFMANGPPVTRTIIDGKFGVHFQEDSEHCRVKHVQTCRSHPRHAQLPCRQSPCTLSSVTLW